MPFYPQGKTSLARSLLNFPGRYAWCIMESVGAINLLYILWHNQHHQTNNGNGDGNGIPILSHFQTVQSLPTWHKVLIALYVLHYLNRAIITPLFLAPSMSPIHLVIILSAMSFNYLNSSCLASWLLGYEVPVTSSAHTYTYQSSKTRHPLMSELNNYLPYIGLVLFTVGMYGNIRSENTLFKLRREEAHRLEAARRRGDNKHSQSRSRSQSQSQSKDVQPTRKSIYDKVYIIPPPTGYFRSILFPHYVYEWLEWAGFLLIGFSIAPYASGAEFDGTRDAFTGAKAVPLASYYAPLADFLINKCGLSFPLPAIAFFVNGVVATSPRASWGRRWYVDRFGKKAVAGRGSVIPYFKWIWRGVGGI